MDSSWHFPPSLPFIRNASSFSVLIVSEEACGRVEDVTSRPIILAFKFLMLKPLGEEDSLVKTKYLNPTYKGRCDPTAGGTKNLREGGSLPHFLTLPAGQQQDDRE